MSEITKEDALDRIAKAGAEAATGPQQIEVKINPRYCYECCNWFPAVQRNGELDMSQGTCRASLPQAVTAMQNGPVPRPICIGMHPQMAPTEFACGQFKMR
jgi:hypothetical protein